MDKKEFIKVISPYFMFPHDDGEMEKSIMRGLDQLINSVIGEYLQNKLNNYDVGSLEFKIIEEWISKDNKLDDFSTHYNRFQVKEDE